MGGRPATSLAPMVRLLHVQTDPGCRRHLHGIGTGSAFPGQPRTASQNFRKLLDRFTVGSMCPAMALAAEIFARPPPW